MLLILSKDPDSFVNQVIDELEFEFIRIGSQDPIEIEQVNISDQNTDLSISSEFFNVKDLNQVSSIWFNGGRPSSSGNTYENMCYAELIDSLLNLKRIGKVGRPSYDFFINKFDVLTVAQEEGFKVPETLITGKKECLEEFYNKHLARNGIICKRLLDQLFYQRDGDIYDFTSPFVVDADTLDEVPSTFSVSMFQEKIDLDYEVRVVIIDQQCFAMAILTKDNVFDYRSRLISNDNIRTIPFTIPEVVKNSLLRLFDRFNLKTGSVDLIVKGSDFYLLEINPSGQISFLNSACNYYLERTFSKMIIDEKG